MKMCIYLNLGASIVLATLLICAGCGQKSDAPSAQASRGGSITNGAFEVTAKLVEVPEGAIFKRDLYDYATILKYEIVQVHRGDIKDKVIHIGHYNPWKPRAAAADQRVNGIGGNVRQFEAGQIHRLGLEAPIEDHYMGGIVNKYFGQTTNTLYWAVWTNQEK